MKLFYSSAIVISLLTITFFVLEYNGGGALSLFKSKSLTGQQTVTPDTEKSKTGKTESRKHNIFGKKQTSFLNGVPFVPNISAVKTVDKTSGVVAGDVLTYNIIIANTGSETANNLTFLDDLDANTTFVSGSLKTSPVAFDDVYDCLGNVGISVPVASGILTNDELGASTPATFVAVVDDATTQGGVISINENGSFTYTPAAGFTGDDSYTYTLTNDLGSSDATITITVEEMIWFIDNSYAGSVADGRLSTPFKTIAAFQAVNDGAGLHPKADENIFLYEDPNPFDGNITLLNGQKLIGQDATTTLAAILTITIPAHSSPALPALNSGNADFVNLTATGSTDVISLNGGASGDYIVRGLTIGNKVTGSGITGTDFGTLTFSETKITGTGRALNLSGGTLNGTFSELSASSGVNGLSLINVAGNITIGSGSLTGTSSTAFSIGSGAANSGGTCTITFNGTIFKSNPGKAVEIQNKTEGTIFFTNLIFTTGSSAGINLNNNTGAIIDFSGGLSLSTTTNTAFSATGGGTVTAKQNGSIINTITTTTGIGLNVVNTTIGGSGLTFRSISVNGASKGIVLDNTGVSGGFTITGEGTTAASGGTIQNISLRGIEIKNAQNIDLKNLTINNGNTTDGGFAGVCDETNNGGCNAAIFITNTTTVNLDRINIANTKEQGINLNNVTGLNITDCTVSGNGDAAEEGALKFRNLKGTCAISNSVFKNSAYRIAHIINTEGNLQLSVMNSSFINEAAYISAIKQDCFELRTQSAATATVLLTNSTFKRAGTKGVQIAAENTSTVDLAITGCTVDREGTLMAGIEVISDQTAVMNANVDDNPLITGDQEVPLNIYSGSSSTMQGTARDNLSITGGNNPLLNSFATLRAYAAEQSNSKVLLSNNAVNNTDEEGILIGAADGVNQGSINATVEANTVTLNAGSLNGIALRSVAISGPANSNCSNVKGNVVNGSSVPSAFTITTGPPDSKIELQSNSGSAVADLAAIWNGNSNTPASPPSTVLKFQTLLTTITYGGVTCLLPSNLVVPTVASTTPTDELINAVNDLKEVSNVKMVDALSLNNKNLKEESVGIQQSDSVIRQTNNIESYADEIQSIVVTTSSQNVSISGITLPASESMVISFQATVNDPLPTSACSISNQGSVSGSEITTILTDNDDDADNGIDPTVSVIKDITAPVVNNCPATITVQTGSGNTDCNQTATWTEPTATDNCSGPLTYFSRTYAPGEFFEKGTTVVTYTFKDPAGNESTCNFNVVVQDNTPPVITCPSNVTAEAACGSSSTVVTYPAATASDNCPGIGAIQYSKASGTSFPLGTTTVNVNVTDAAGKTSTCPFTVTVNQAPNCNSNVLEAELASLNKVVVASNHTGYTGSGFGDYINASGDYIEWTLDKPGGGSATFKFRYANGSGSNRPLSLQINGQIVQANLAFPVTGSWTNWSFVTVNSNLLCGVNKIRLTAIGSSGANIDHLAWTATTPASGTLQAEAASLNNAVVASNHSGYTGLGFVDYINPSGDYIEWTLYKAGGGSTTLKFRYANGASNRPLKLSINGTVVTSSLSFPATGAWTNWSTVTVTKNLICGVNKIRLTAIGSSGANIDKLDWSAASSSSDMLESNDLITEVEKGALTIKVFPNPATHHFNISTSSRSDKPLSLRVIDAFGRIVEVRAGVAANGTLQFGQLYKAGLYYVEIIQGAEKRTIKLMKARS